MIITICGMPGSGKGTVGRLLAARLGYEYYSMGDLRRAMAKERGLTLAELNKMGEANEFSDRPIDEFQTELGKTKDNLVVDARLAFHFIPHAIKVFLDVDLDVAAKRLLGRPQSEEAFMTATDAKASILQRMASDRKRYKQYYGTDCYDQKHFDIIIDTSHRTPEQIVDHIMRALP